MKSVEIKEMLLDSLSMKLELSYLPGRLIEKMEHYSSSTHLIENPPFFTAGDLDNPALSYQSALRFGFPSEAVSDAQK